MPSVFPLPLSWEPIEKYINEQYEKFLKEEVNIARKKRIPDTRVHCCLYFISPTGHSYVPDPPYCRPGSSVCHLCPRTGGEPIRGQMTGRSWPCDLRVPQTFHKKEIKAEHHCPPLPNTGHWYPSTTQLYQQRELEQRAPHLFNRYLLWPRLGAWGWQER